jgi:hypothetical protein
VKISFLKNCNVFLNVYVKVYIYNGKPNISLFFVFVEWQISKELSIGGIFQSTMSRLKRRHHLNVDVQKRGSMFAKCTICESLKNLISKLGKNNNEALKYEVKLRKHILHQESRKNLYHIWRTELVLLKDGFLCIIHDKMEHAKITLPRLQVCNKMIFGLG